MVHKGNSPLGTRDLTPRQIVEELDRYIVGQSDANGHLVSLMAKRLH